MHHRYLIGVPMVKVETLGAGGGSICHVNAGALEVGPKSAGAEPGPICYGRGGEQPTMTDALVMLGILSADSEFAGGSFCVPQRRESRRRSDDRRADGIRCRRSCLRFMACRECQYDPSRQAIHGRKGHRSDRYDHARVRGQWACLRGRASARVWASTESWCQRHLPPSPRSVRWWPIPASTRSALTSRRRSALDVGKLRSLWRELDQRAERYFSEANFSRHQVFAKYQMKMRYPGQNWSLTFDVKTNQGAGICLCGRLSRSESHRCLQ